MENYNYTKLKIKNFGKLKDVEIEFASLVVFTGDSGSGKSLLFNLYYGLITYNFEVINLLIKNEKDLFTTDKYIEIKGKLKNFIYDLKNEDKRKLDDALIKDFVDLYNYLLNKHSRKVLQYILNSDDQNLNLDYIEFCFNYDLEFYLNCSYKYSIGDINKVKSDCVLDIEVYKNNNRICKGVSCSLSDDDNFYKNIIKNYMIFIIDNLFTVGNNLLKYIPDTRKELLLLRNILYKQSVYEKFSLYDEKFDLIEGSVKENDYYMRKSSVDFVNFFIHCCSNTVNDNLDIIDYFEKLLLFGKIVVNNETNNIYYKPYNSDEKIQLYNAPSFVLELAPLYLFLKFGCTDALIIENPESSLDKTLQLCYVMLISKLLENNKSVMMTTYSEFILHQIDKLFIKNRVRIYDFDLSRKNNEVIVKLI